MISIPFNYSKDKNLKLLVQFDNWFSRQKKFILRVDGERIYESDVADEVYVAQAGEKYYAIRFEPNFLTPTLYIDKEPFVLGEKLKWFDYFLVFILFVSLQILDHILISRGNPYFLHYFLLALVITINYFAARYISLSKSRWKRWVIAIPCVIIIGGFVLNIFAQVGAK